MSHYLAGPMTGRPRWGFDAFEEAAKLLREEGLAIVSPHELDLDHGFDPDAPAEQFTREHLLAALRRDVLAVLDSEGLVVLPGWEDSKGARAEVSLAYAAGITVRTVPQARDYARSLHHEGNPE